VIEKWCVKFWRDIEICMNLEQNIPCLDLWAEVTSLLINASIVFKEVKVLIGRTSTLFYLVFSSLSVMALSVRVVNHCTYIFL